MMITVVRGLRNNLMAEIECHVDAPFPETHLPRKA